ncbi:hypothetical protein CPC08DRAFT_755788 [Agrocybe pediades]|nr:hypothetical protein CPC08DRAFT_755788 [Agrocybe pediades]
MAKLPLPHIYPPSLVSANFSGLERGWAKTALLANFASSELLRWSFAMCSTCLGYSDREGKQACWSCSICVGRPGQGEPRYGQKSSCATFDPPPPLVVLAFNGFHATDVQVAACSCALTRYPSSFVPRLYNFCIFLRLHASPYLPTFCAHTVVHSDLGRMSRRKVPDCPCSYPPKCR